MHGNKLLYGFTNCVYFNRRASGDTSYFATREQRDAAWAGIYPVKRRFGTFSLDFRENFEASEGLEK